MRRRIPAATVTGYIRHGTTSLFAALEVATGKVTGQCHGRHRHQEFLKFLKLLNKSYPVQEGQSLHIILDNYATHSTEAVRKWLARHPHFHLHFTPTGASWLNQIERFFGLITEQRIRRGSFRFLQTGTKRSLGAYSSPWPRCLGPRGGILRSITRSFAKSSSQAGPTQFNSHPLLQRLCFTENRRISTVS